MGAACFWRAIVGVRTSRQNLIRDIKEQELTRECHDKPVFKQLGTSCRRKSETKQGHIEATCSTSTRISAYLRPTFSTAPLPSTKGLECIVADLQLTLNINQHTHIEKQRTGKNAALNPTTTASSLLPHHPDLHHYRRKPPRLNNPPSPPQLATSAPLDIITNSPGGYKVPNSAHIWDSSAQSLHAPRRTTVHG